MALSRRDLSAGLDRLQSPGASRDGEHATKSPCLSIDMIPDFAADAVQEEKLHGIGQGLGAVALQLLIQTGQGVAHGLGADLLAEEFPGDGFQFSGADPVQEELAEGGVHVPTPRLRS
jgi:hypothetical protein